MESFSNREQNEEIRRERARERSRQYYQQNTERIRERSRQWREENEERIRERTREWRLTSENARCNDGCIDILHSDKFISFKYKKKFECPGVRVCYSCAVEDIRLSENNLLKMKKKEYYNIYTTKVGYLHRIEYAILNKLNEDPFIDMLNQSSLNIHDKDIVALLGKSTEIEKRPDRAYLINNHLIFFEVDERLDHEKSIERLRHIRNRLQSKFENMSSL